MIFVLYADVEPLNDDELFEYFYKNISETRQKKINAFRMRKDRNLSLGASVLLDCGLNKLFGLREKEMQYGFSGNGRPFLKNRPDIYFSVSHSGTKAVAAFSDAEIGADIEKIKNADLKIAKRFFDEKEYDYLNSITDSEKQTAEFYRLWTMKESYMKFTGLGMKLPLDSFCIEFNENRAFCGETVFYEHDGISGYRLSVCSRNKNEKPEIECMGFQKG